MAAKRAKDCNQLTFAFWISERAVGNVGVYVDGSDCTVVAVLMKNIKIESTTMGVV